MTDLTPHVLDGYTVLYLFLSPATALIFGRVMAARDGQVPR